MTNRKAKNRRPQTPKPNRHEHVLDLRRGSRAQPHRIQTESRSVRKYGIRAILNDKD